MNDILHAALSIAESHTGFFAGVFFLLCLVVLYWRGEMNGFFPWLGRAASDKGEPSAKNLSYILAAATLCWGFAKMTLAICRKIDKDWDPTMVYSIYMGVLAALVGVTKIMAMKARAGQFDTTGAPESAPKDEAKDEPRP